LNSPVTLRVAQYATSTSIGRLPREVVERAKQVILDEMACAHFGRRSLAGELAVRYVTTLGGPAEARILGTRLRVPAVHAALANGAAGHGDEVDGAHVVGGHPGATLVHAAVAMVQRQRSSGAELVNAVVLGYDIGVRLIAACGSKFGLKNRLRLHADFLHAIGAAVAASRLLGLDAERHCHAMALATFQSNGLEALYQEKRHISKSLCNGQYAGAGVSAALMSAAGLEGNDDIIGAPYGLLDAWGIEGGQEILLAGLGDDFAIMRGNFKFLNAGYPIHAAVEAAMTLARQRGLHADAIESVRIGLPTNAARVVDNREMHNICAQDMVSAALVRDGLGLRESPFPAILSDPAYARLRLRVELRGHPDLDRDQPEGRGAIVTIDTVAGTSHTLRVDHPRGHSQRGGVSWAELAEKWHEGLPDCDVDRMVVLAQRLEQLDDIRDLADLFGD